MLGSTEYMLSLPTPKSQIQMSQPSSYLELGTGKSIAIIDYNRNLISFSEELRDD